MFPPCKRHGFSLLETIVAAALIGVVLAILLPVLRSVRRNADNMRCIANLRQLGNAGLLFTWENNGFLPDAGRWFSRTADDKFSLLPYLGMPPGSRSSYEPSALACPSAHASIYRSSDVAGWHRTYALNQYAMGSHDRKPDDFAKTLTSGIPVRFQSIKLPAQMAFSWMAPLPGPISLPIRPVAPTRPPRLTPRFSPLLLRRAPAATGRPTFTTRPFMSSSWMEPYGASPFPKGKTCSAVGEALRDTRSGEPV